jgi:hypothetical protein
MVYSSVLRVIFFIISLCSLENSGTSPLIEGSYVLHTYFLSSGPYRDF